LLPTVFRSYPEDAKACLRGGQARLDDADKLKYSFEGLCGVRSGRLDAAFQATSACLAHVKDDAQRRSPVGVHADVASLGQLASGHIGGDPSVSRLTTPKSGTGRAR
jgi:hypothetical protein